MKQLRQVFLRRQLSARGLQDHQHKKLLGNIAILAGQRDPQLQRLHTQKYHLTGLLNTQRQVNQ